LTTLDLKLKELEI